MLFSAGCGDCAGFAGSGVFFCCLECMPPPVAAAATSALRIPNIGIGAGPFCSGQVRSLIELYNSLLVYVCLRCLYIYSV
jgi:hypothetical protein